MINRQALLADLQKFLQRIEADLLERSESTEVPEVPAALHAEYEKASKAERTAQNYEDWRTDTITQAAAAWVLSCVFVRFLEDNSLIDPPKIAGPCERLARARDEHELYFRSYPQHTDREYLLSIFAELAKLPGTKGVFGEHNAINDLPNWLSGDGAGELLNFFQKIDASTGALVHDFTDPNWDTRFLGDLYQDLSEAARKKYALLQTPDFVEEFILDRTLEPALDEFGLEQDLGSSNNGKLPGFDDRSTLRIPFKMIDPACGSGHFLLGAFPRLLNRWQRKEPGTNIRELTQRALNSIHGVDINPFAVAIAKFRLLLVAMKSCDIQRLVDAPAFQVNVACGDSLLHGENRTSTGQNLMDFADGATDQELYAHAYPGEDLQSVRTLLRPGTYQCVVANPPYIVPKDRKLNDWYRKRFSACHMQYSLAVPFMQQIFQLSAKDGYTGQITANSFMKREFGKKLIESFIPTVDLTHVIDTGGAYIPGHGTPTTILFGRNRQSLSTTLRTVLGIRGEPSTPTEPAKGLVWSSIICLIDRSGEKDTFVSSGDSERELFHKHPWSIGGGGAAELKQTIETSAKTKLEDHIESIGRTTAVGEDDAWLLDHVSIKRKQLTDWSASLVLGEMVRDWMNWEHIGLLYPYDGTKRELVDELSFACLAHLWPYKALLRERRIFGKSLQEHGKPWYVHLEHYVSKLRSAIGIGSANIATHLHFYLDRSGSLFNSTAPVIKLPSEATEDDYLALIGLVNSSTACFWLKQVCFPKGTATGDISKEKGKAESNRFAFGATAIGALPFPEWSAEDRRRIIDLSRAIVTRADKLRALISMERLNSHVCSSCDTLGTRLESDRAEVTQIKKEMIFLQEELDWAVYAIYRLAPDFPTSFPWDEIPSVAASDRPFISRTGSADLPHIISDCWSSRLQCIDEVEAIRLIETPMYKRPWLGRQGVYGSGSRTIAESQRDVQASWLLNRLESSFDFDGRMTGNKLNRQGDDGTNSKAETYVPTWCPLSEIRIYSVAQLADTARQDPRFMEVGELYRDDPAFDVQALVEELVLAESVPHLPILRYKDSGLRKRAEWEKTWELQRNEDAGESIGAIPVPPKYTSADFISTGGARYWSLRGKLDVPKERWISFPHCEGPDGTLVICWAGYDHLQQAQAISAYYVRVQTEFGGSDDPRLIPLLASLIELIPWLKQWHNEPNASFDGLRMGDYFEGFVNEEARNMGKTLQEIRDWVPPKKVAKTKAPKRASKKAKSVEVDE